MVRIECSYFGIQRVVEEYLSGYEQQLFKASHRKLWCWLDSWIHRQLAELLEEEKRLNEEMTKRMRGALGDVSTADVELPLDCSFRSDLSFNSAAGSMDDENAPNGSSSSPSSNLSSTVSSAVTAVSSAHGKWDANGEDVSEISGKLEKLKTGQGVAAQSR
mmetsp:Transcript_1015/g.2345  ORF Transcript_1015/g.2345 Transcript_1015/m.2345 type:complete len:161 (-) Transcript_1015:136-618(-)